jgi:spore maturation protein CgeB
MKVASLDIAFFGSSLVSAYWNGAAAYYRGLLRALAERGHRITFYEPDAFRRQAHRDIADPAWAKVAVYPSDRDEDAWRVLEQARDADLLVKASGVGVFDALLEAGVLEVRRPGSQVAYWDVDAHATLDRLRLNPHDPLASLIPQYDFVFTYGGGDPVVAAYAALGARCCVPIYNALDPQTHLQVPPVPRFRSDLTFVGKRRPDREARVTEFFLRAARLLPSGRLLLVGNGWDTKPMPLNVTQLGHVFAHEQNALYCSATAVLNVTRETVARYGFSPPRRIFEAAGAAACLISDAWPGIETFLEPGREVLVARDGAEVAAHVLSLTPARARQLGRAARARVLSEHTYDHRAAQLERVLGVRRPVELAQWPGKVSA